ncbi:OmpP1/FadL family transporter [Adhaeretor mobilis]|uniref:Outer membrane protein transport protein (OMPP1/FadL/TodX) n=1 Tax=Adhaeretor mobilis TaxID=1930276 RepID=A0A517N145_9BACT|nr:outer membrane protein transport protein [Adhaeretor mobilis]QDT00859.1 Outer membrane protein transport protein (OMPP1/FadL/TodX) [Adhaeretor mobilis]
MSCPRRPIARRLIFSLAVAIASLIQQDVSAQSFGVELHAAMMPASGGMGGVSVARPQDVQSAFTGNPATLTQFRGTQFSFGSGWVEPTINVDNDANLPLASISPYEAKSGSPGNALANIAVTQDFSALGLPVTWGAAFISGAGLGVKYFDAPESNGSAASLLALHVASGVGVQVSDRLSVGAQLYVTTGILDGPFSGLGSATTAYGLRGLFGATYQATDHTTLGCYWMTKESFRFEDAVRLSLGGGAFSTAQDIQLDLPETFGWGIANDRLMGGRLLLASDILYKRYSESDFFRAIWEDQFVLQTGAQYSLTQNIRIRLGYTFAEYNMLDAPSLVVGGVIPPDGLPAIQYLQSQFPSINEHRLSAGFGIRDFLPGVDFDVNAGGMFFTEDQFGQSAANVESYWVAGGLTWRFGRGSSERAAAPNSWCKDCVLGSDRR